MTLDAVGPVALAGGSLWALATDNDGSCVFTTDYVERIDAASGRVLGKTTVGCAGAILGDGTDLWVLPLGGSPLLRVRPAPASAAP